MPTPMATFARLAAQFGIDPNDAAAVETFYVHDFPNLRPEIRELLLDSLLNSDDSAIDAGEHVRTYPLSAPLPTVVDAPLLTAPGPGSDTTARRRHSTGTTLTSSTATYHLDELINDGGNGRTYKAHDTLGNVFAIKLFEGATEDRRFGRLINEAHATGQLAQAHPAFVAPVELLRLDDAVAIVFPFLEGCTLFAWVQRRQRALSWREASSVFLPVASALQAAHNVGIVHRDVTPTNVFLEFPTSTQDADLSSARVRLLDLGTVKLPPGSSVLPPTNVDSVIGSWQSMPPEQLPQGIRGIFPDLAKASVSPASDVYSFAASLVFALTQHYPVEHQPDEPNVARALRVLRAEPDMDGVSATAGVHRFLLAALSKHPDDRPTIEGVIAAMEKASQATVAVDTRSEPEPWGRAVCRDAPALITILVDQSTSMRLPFGGGTQSKASAVADVVNDYIDKLVFTCLRAGGEIRPYYEVMIVGYGPGGARHLLPQPIVGVADLDALAKYETRVGPGGDGEFEFPIWIEPTADGSTPMVAAMSLAERSARDWIASHQHSLPPVIFNVTDGDSTDGDMVVAAGRLKALPALVLCCHVSHARGPQILFSEIDPKLGSAPPPDRFASLLWQASSELPSTLLHNLIRNTGRAYAVGTRGYMFNVPSADEIRLLLTIGTPVPAAT